MSDEVKKKEFSYFIAKTNYIYGEVGKIQIGLNGQGVRSNLTAAFEHFEDTFQRLNKSSSPQNYRKYLKQFEIFISAIYRHLADENVSEEIMAIARSARGQAEHLKKEFESSHLNRQVFEAKTTNLSKLLPDELLKHQEQMDHSQEIEQQLQQRDWQIKQLNQEIESSKKYINQLTSNLNDLEKNTEEQVDKTHKKAQEQLLAKLNEADQKLNDIGAITAHASDLKQKCDELYTYASTGFTSGDFGNAAKEEKKKAEIFRVFSIVTIIALIAMEVNMRYLGFNLTPNAYHFLESILIFVPFGVLAAYLAREASQHRQKYYRYIRVHLDLRTIDPFITKLPEAEQHKVKIELAHRIFAQDSLQDGSKSEFPLDVQKIIMELIKKVSMQGGK